MEAGIAMYKPCSSETKVFLEQMIVDDREEIWT